MSFVRLLHQILLDEPIQEAMRCTMEVSGIIITLLHTVCGNKHVYHLTQWLVCVLWCVRDTDSAGWIDGRDRQRIGTRSPILSLLMYFHMCQGMVLQGIETMARYAAMAKPSGRQQR